MMNGHNTSEHEVQTTLDLTSIKREVIHDGDEVWEVFEEEREPSPLTELIGHTEPAVTQDQGPSNANPPVFPELLSEPISPGMADGPIPVALLSSTESRLEQIDDYALSQQPVDIIIETDISPEKTEDSQPPKKRLRPRYTKPKPKRKRRKLKKTSQEKGESKLKSSSKSFQTYAGSRRRKSTVHDKSNRSFKKVTRKVHTCTECSEQFSTLYKLRIHLFSEHGKSNLKGSCRKRKSCNLCDKSFHNKARLTNHMFRAHQIGSEADLYKDPKRHPCSECDQRFITPSRLKYHMFRVHGKANPEDLPVIPKRYPCMTCGKIMSSKKRYNHHIYREHGQGDSSFLIPTHYKHKCDHCVKSYHSSTRLKVHLYNAHGKGDPEALPKRRIHQCSFCDKGLSTSVRLRMHLFKEHGHGEQYVVEKRKKHICEDCGKDLGKPSRLRIHQFRAHGKGDPESLPKEKTYPCSSCDKVLSSLVRLRIHVYKDHGEGEMPTQAQKKVMCELCGSLFWNPARLKRHIYKVHAEGDPPNGTSFTCQVCKLELDSVFSFAEHAMVHLQKQSILSDGETSTDNNPYPTALTCPLCDEIREEPFLLKTHIVSAHNPDTAYVCNTCGKGFRTPSHLKKHEKIHSTDTPHLCTICGKSFRTIGSLKHHELIHDKQWFCAVCEKASTSRAALIRHSKTHSLSKDFECDVCGKCFKTKTTRNRHKQKMHPDTSEDDLSDFETVDSNNEDSTVDQTEQCVNSIAKIFSDDSLDIDFSDVC